MTRVRLLMLASLLAMVFQSRAAPGFYLREQKVNAPEMGELLTYVLVSGSDEFAFVPPFEWRVATDSSPPRLLLTPRDRTASISILLTDSNPALKTEAQPEVLRQQVLRRFTKARLAGEFSCYTSSHAGRGFDIAWTGPGDVEMTSRLALFPTSSGSIEFTLSTATGRFRNVQQAFGGLLTSFQQREVSKGRRSP